ncbi:von Willebrand factor D and EGF domain-containing protein-like [Saccostrea cucullata]|uniref:von Willebrand factor D and EGF domain-containing protein-like n=1 Tax=Saccostrea cuccullata TaxID=36930 RepID=UPI002ED13731
MEILYLFFFVYVPLLIQCKEEDPCSYTVYRNLTDLPKRNPSFFMDYLPICDIKITKGWYRAEYYKMSTSPPSLGYCGTLYPFWFSGSHPPTASVNDATACLKGFIENCTQKIDIKVKNCTTYMVYHLKPVFYCNSGYCFELSDNCVKGVPSNLSVSYHNVSWVSKVFGTSTLHSPSVMFKCSFTPLPDTSLFYEISWYVDDIEVVRSETLSYNSLENALLSSKQIAQKQKKAGSTISCLVGAKYKEDGFACKTASSKPFFAGIKVLTPTITMTRGGSASIQLQFTIPYVMESLEVNHVFGNQFCLFVSLATVEGNLTACRAKDAKHCDIEIKAYRYNEREYYATDKWKEIHTMNIYNTDNSDFKDATRDVTLRLQTGGTHSIDNIFENVTLPDIQASKKLEL